MKFKRAIPFAGIVVPVLAALDTLTQVVLTIDQRLARGADLRVVVEAKDRAVSMRAIREGLREARENRGAAVGLAVSRVIRVRYGDVALGELYRGASRPLSSAETKALYALAGIAPRTKHQGRAER